MMTLRLGEISAFITKGATPTTYGFKWERSGVPFLRSECVSEQGLDMRQSMFISPRADQVLRRSQVNDGDILITITGNVGRVIKLAGLGTANINQHIARIRVKDYRFDAGYVYHYLSQRTMREYYETIVTGQAYPQISLTQVRNTPIPVLPLGEQRQVAAVLDDTDDLVASLERLIAKKQAIKQGTMQQLLTGRTRLPGFAGEWSELTLGDVAQFSKGMGLPKSAIVPGGHLPCVHYGELFTHYGPEIGPVTSRTNDLSLRVRSVANDVLMPTSDVTPRGLAKASAIGLDGVVLGGDILVIRPNRQRVFGPFLAHAIRYDANQVLQLVRGSTVYHLYASDMKTFRLALPNVDEQLQISEVLRDAEHEIEVLRNRLTKANAVKAGMMQQLLTGRTRLPSEVRS